MIFPVEIFQISPRHWRSDLAGFSGFREEKQKTWKAGYQCQSPKASRHRRDLQGVTVMLGFDPDFPGNLSKTLMVD
jgi:hypothetical protein